MTFYKPLPSCLTFPTPSPNLTSDLTSWLFTLPYAMYTDCLSQEVGGVIMYFGMYITYRQQLLLFQKKSQLLDTILEPCNQ